MGVEETLGNNVITTSLDKVVNWSRSRSLWPMTFGLACCAIEMMATGAARFDLEHRVVDELRPAVAAPAGDEGEAVEQVEQGERARDALQLGDVRA